MSTGDGRVKNANCTQVTHKWIGSNSFWDVKQCRANIWNKERKKIKEWEGKYVLRCARVNNLRYRTLTKLPSSRAMLYVFFTAFRVPFTLIYGIRAMASGPWIEEEETSCRNVQYGPRKRLRLVWCLWYLLESSPRSRQAAVCFGIRTAK